MRDHLLFSYGTLQHSVFGAAIGGEPDAVVGHRLGEVVIDDPHVVEVSGSAVHPGLDADRRVEVPLRSGRTAWVYAIG